MHLPKKPENNRLPLCPVIVPVPSDVYEQLAVRERSSFLSRQARRALMMSIQQLSAYTEKPPEVLAARLTSENAGLPKDGRGAPVPVDGWHWCVSHKSRYAGGVVSPEPVGMDIEEIRPVMPQVFEKITDAGERQLLAADNLKDFFRCWTAKEAVLKQAGTGLSGLSGCRIVENPGEQNLVIRYADRLWIVEHVCFNNHIAAIVRDNRRINWHIG